MEILAQYNVSPSSISPSPGPPMGPLYGGTPVPELSSTHKPPVYEPCPRFPSEASMERGAHLQSLLLVRK